MQPGGGEAGVQSQSVGIHLNADLPIFRESKVNQSHYRPEGPKGSRKLRFPDYVTMAHDGGKVVSLTYRPPLPPVNTPGTRFY